MAEYKTAAQALTADRYSYPIDCRRGVTIASFQIISVETGTPVVKFKFQGSNDPRVENDLYIPSGSGTQLYGTSSEAASWSLLTLPATAVIHGTGFTAPTLPATEIDWNGSAALNMMVIFEAPPARIRLWADWQSGGGASALMTVYATDNMP